MATLYRVVQESLTNALRHAPGSQVDVTIHTGHTTGDRQSATARPSSKSSAAKALDRRRVGAATD